MCSNCQYGHKCRDCAYNLATQHSARSTGLDTSDMRTYKREWMRRKRAADLERDMRAAGVA